MRKTFFFLGLSLLILGCKDFEESSDNNAESELVAKNYKSFGTEILPAEVEDEKIIAEMYSGLKPGDTLEVNFASRVNSLCKKKGCWMIVEVPGEKVRVTFKGYGFFVPKDIENREVVVSGKAFVEEMSVEDQQHYADDAGKNEEEIAAIKEPKLQRSFIAEGVLLKD